MACHTPRDDKGQLIMSRLSAGGERFQGPWGVCVARKLTPDADMAAMIAYLHTLKPQRP